MRAAAVLALVATTAWAGAARGAAAPGPADSTRNLVAIEFLESPPTGLVVSGGLLGVPDSSGRFPERYQRSDSTTGRMALPGRAVGDLLVFTDLEPGTYRVALVFLDESKLAKRLLPKNRSLDEDRCLVYDDTLSALTFTVGRGQALYLGRLTRHTRPSLEDKNELWRSWISWSPGEERKNFQPLIKRKDMAPWRALLSARIAALDSRGRSDRKR